jgi:RNA polymerase sigma factor for flagellar operon FliA
VRSRVANNLATPATTLTKLAGDSDPDVRWAVVCNPATPADTVAKLVAKACTDVQKEVFDPWRSRWWTSELAKLKPKEAELIEQYLPFVKNVVGRLALSLPSHVDLDDLYSAGLVGLLNAVRNYDPTAGSSFESYARVRIRGSIFDELRRLDWVPRSVHDKARKVQAVIQQIEQSKGQPPTDVEIAAALGLSMNEYDDLMNQIRPATFVCLDAVSGNEDGGETAHHETISDEAMPDPVDSTVRNEMARLIEKRLSTLPEMQRKVLALYYFEDLRLREIAEVFGLTESRICQIHSQAILALRGYLQRMVADDR